MNDEEGTKALRIPGAQNIFTTGLVVLVGAAVVFLVISIQTDAKERARKRAADLKMLKQSLVDNSGTLTKDTIYPQTMAPDYRRYGEKKDSGWTNECDQPNNWISGLSSLIGKLPKDPKNACRARISGDPYPQYRYISDGFNFKIAAFSLGDEICKDSEFAELVDPARPCEEEDASWAVYTDGARNW